MSIFGDELRLGWFKDELKEEGIEAVIHRLRKKS